MVSLRYRAYIMDKLESKFCVNFSQIFQRVLQLIFHPDRFSYVYLKKYFGNIFNIYNRLEWLYLPQLHMTVFCNEI